MSERGGAKAEDFSVEDDKDTQDWMSSSSASEFRALLKKKAYEHRLGKVRYLRSLGKDERKRLRAKYTKPQAAS